MADLLGFSRTNKSSFHTYCHYFPYFPWSGMRESSQTSCSGCCSTHIILIKNLFGAERSTLQTLGGDRLLTVTSIISS